MEQGFLDGMSSMHGLFAQGGFIFAGLLLTGLGFALEAAALRWKLRGTPVEGTVIGTRRHGKYFYPVYRYNFPYESENFEAMSDTGTTSPAAVQTGTTVKLRVFRDNPGAAHAEGGPLLALLGFALLVPGVVFLYHAFTAYEVNGITYALSLAFVLYSLNKFRRIFGTRKQRKEMAEIQGRQWQALETQTPDTIEELRNDPSFENLQKVTGSIGTVFAVTGALMLCFCLYLTSGKAMLALGGLKAEGTVIELAERQSGGKNSRNLYHPVVRFESTAKNSFTFTDGAGASPAAFDEGDKVDVLYLAKDPQESATLDHGAIGWLAPAALAIAGVLFLLKGLSLMPRQRDEVR